MREQERRQLLRFWLCQNDVRGGVASYGVALRLLQFLRQAGDAGLVHGFHGVFPDTLEYRVDRLFACDGPGSGGGGEDVAEADGFGGQLQLRAALRAFALDYEAGL